MLTLAADGPDVALTEALAEADDDELAFELELEAVLDLLLEQPARPATTIAAPPMATTNPRFTNVLLCRRGPSTSPDHLQQYGVTAQRRSGDWVKIRL
jgi:hypothetical protein